MIEWAIGIVTGFLWVASCRYFYCRGWNASNRKYVAELREARGAEGSGEDWTPLDTGENWKR